jgi:hypothetical protein
MDYAFAPGTTPYDTNMKRLFRRCPNTTLIDVRTVRHVAAFINHLDTTASIPKPVGDLLIASHGNDRGWLQIDLDGGRSTDVTYEVLEAAATSGTVEIPTSLIQNPDGTSVSIKVHIRGCRIGKSLAFMQKLKQALGGSVGVTAPLHFHEYYHHGSYGLWEFLSYDFSLARKTRLRTKNDVVTAFQGASFTFINGSSVPAGNWTTWVPSTFNQATTDTNVNITLGTTIGSLSQLTLEREFRHRRRTYTYTVSGVTSKPASDAAALAILQSALSGDPTFQSSHAYPIYERYGYSSRSDFVNGFTWSYTHGSNQLVCTGTRHEYTCIVPITDPSTHHLIFNFYPNAGSSHSAIVNLLETDSRMFRTV